MLALLPLVCFGLVWLGLKTARPTSGWRSTFLAAALVWGLLVLIITEGLSLFRRLGYGEIAAAWSLSLAGAALYLARRPHRPHSLKLPALAGYSRFEGTLLAIGLVIVSTVGVIGWVAAPNTWDSMTYHMSRVMHWIQNGSVAHYPTHILRQLHQNPWAEFAILHMQVLSGSDRWANLIQWFSMVGAAVGVSLVARQLGADRRGQVFAALIGLLIPMGIQQGSSTQNDYVVAFWLVSCAYFALRLRADGQTLHAGAAGASLGLAVLTKPTAYLFALPLVAWLGLALIKAHPVRGGCAIGLMAIAALAINGGHYTRNYTLYGNPLGPGEEAGGLKYANDEFSLAGTTTNLVRNIGLHLGTPSNTLNAWLESGLYQLLQTAGLDPNDPGTTWGSEAFHIRFGMGEVDAGNLLHLVFIGVSLTLLLGQPNRRQSTHYYAAGLIAGFVIFCVYLRWQPWHSRLHLPLFVLWAALIGACLAQIRTQRIANWCMLILLLGSQPHLLLILNPTRPLITAANIFATSRAQGYFASRPWLAQPYMEATQFLAATPCTELGLVMGENDFEYPLWALLGEAVRPPARLEHVNVGNISQGLGHTPAYAAFRPCAVIVINDSPSPDIRVGEVTLHQAWFVAPVSVYLVSAATQVAK